MTTYPKSLRSNTVEARILKQKVYRPMNVLNEHFMGIITGREGSGKSYTALTISQFVDPSFTADRVMFDPKMFLNRLQEWKANEDTKGKMVVCDESGVGLGNRTWYEKDQIKFNQVLQIIRDENMGILFTVPRMEEMDSQTPGRFHAYMEMLDKNPGEWAELIWLNNEPTRDGYGKIYQKRPKLRINGVEKYIDSLRFPPPTTDVAEAYEELKGEFQSRFYESAANEYEDEQDNGIHPNEVADKIIDNDDVNRFIKDNHGQKYIDRDLLEMEYNLSHSKSKKVKKLLQQSITIEVV